MVTRKGLLRQERAFVDRYFKKSAWGFSADGAAGRSSNLDLSGNTADDLVYWNDEDATPIQDVRLAKRLVLERTGFMPNVLGMGRPVFDSLVDHEDIVGRLDRGQTTGPAMANRESLAALFEVDEVLVFDAVYDTAKFGAEAANAFVSGKHALLAYRAETPDVMMPSAGYKFSWRAFIGAADMGVRIKRLRIEDLGS